MPLSATDDYRLCQRTADPGGVDLLVRHWRVGRVIERDGTTDERRMCDKSFVSASFCVPARRARDTLTGQWSHCYRGQEHADDQGTYRVEWSNRITSAHALPLQLGRVGCGPPSDTTQMIATYSRAYLADPGSVRMSPIWHFYGSR